MSNYQPYKAYQMKNGQWGFYGDDECEKFWQPYSTAAAAQKDADTFQEGRLKPGRFTDAWKQSLQWLADRSGIAITQLIDGGGTLAYANKYQELAPCEDGFKQAMQQGSGVCTFAAQIYSFYNTAVAVKLANDDLAMLTPWAAGCRLEKDAKLLLADLSMNYSGW